MSGVHTAKLPDGEICHNPSELAGGSTTGLPCSLQPISTSPSLRTPDTSNVPVPTESAPIPVPVALLRDLLREYGSSVSSNRIHPARCRNVDFRPGRPSLNPGDAASVVGNDTDVVRWNACLPAQRANKKGRGEIAPTFPTSLFTPVPVHPWSKADKRLRQSRTLAWSTHQQRR